jgi:hypothetical protein
VRIKEPTEKIPRPSHDSLRELIQEHAPEKLNYVIPPWLLNLVITAYQNGRYDEACAETFAMALD